MLKPIHKLVNDLDDSMRMLTANAIIQNAVCPQCNTVHVAATPFLSGTSLGPVSLSLIMMFFEKGNTDEGIAEYFQYMFGFKMAPNTVTAARHAVAEAIQQNMIQRIQTFIASRPWIQMDETGFKRGDGHMGYVWVLNCEGACFVVFAGLSPNSTCLTQPARFSEFPPFCTPDPLASQRFSGILAN